MQNHQELKTKKSSTKLLILLLLIVIAAASAVGLYAWARYTESIPGTTTADVAKWNFKIVDGNPETQEIDLIMSRTDGNQNVAAGKLAPGTYGTIPISVDTTGTEVNLKYDLIANITNCPSNMLFYEDEEHTVPIPTTRTETGTGANKVKTASFTLSKYVPKEDTGVHNHTIYWDWPYETEGNGLTLAQNDALDSEDEGKLPCRKQSPPSHRRGSCCPCHAQPR